MKFLDISFKYLLFNLSLIKAFPILSNNTNLFLPAIFFLSCPRCFTIEATVIFLVS